jgi:hypothetical protein
LNFIKSWGDYPREILKLVIWEVDLPLETFEIDHIIKAAFLETLKIVHIIEVTFLKFFKMVKLWRRPTTWNVESGYLRGDLQLKTLKTIIWEVTYSLKCRKQSFERRPTCWNIENYHLRGDLPLETLKMVICHFGANLPLKMLKMVFWKATYLLKHRNWSFGRWLTSKRWNFKIDYLWGDLP